MPEHCYAQQYAGRKCNQLMQLGSWSCQLRISYTCPDSKVTTSGHVAEIVI